MTNIFRRRAYTQPVFATFVGSGFILNGGTSATTLSATLTNAVAVNARLVAVIKTGGGFPPNTPTDTQSNTYAKDAQSTVVGPVSSIYSTKITTALTTSDSVTFTITGSGQQNMGLILIAITGLATNALDKATSGTASAASTLTVGPTATTTVADEMAITGFGIGGNPSGSTTTSISGAWTEVGATTGAADAAAYQALTSTQTVSAPWTESSGGATFNLCGTIATYK